MSEYQDHVRLTLDGHHDPAEQPRGVMRWSPVDAPTESAPPVDPSPSADGTAAALDQAQAAFFALLDALGPGQHTLLCSATTPHGVQVELLQLLTDGGDLIAVNEAEALDFCITLTFAFVPGSAGGVVVRTTTPDGAESARAWSVRGGWLHPLTAREVRDAYSFDPESGGTVEPPQDVDYRSADVLTRPSADAMPRDEDGTRSRTAPPDNRPPNRRN
ncbi:hypothetical protein [Streptomyces sp. NPDC127197]|uniref:hypothetical protein n=1 Tax=Streptomyces sp. NPDC127197 TaxID=3345388 RepID=UPI003628060D